MYIYIMNVGLFTVVSVSVLHGSLLMNIHMNLYICIHRGVIYWTGGRHINHCRELVVKDIQFVEVGKSTVGKNTKNNNKFVDSFA
jgi:hypothetical protein